MSAMYAPREPLPTSGFRQALGPLGEDEGLAFGEALSPEEVERAFREEGVDFGAREGAVYTPHLTFWAFLSQTVCQGVDRSCQAAVHRVFLLCLLLGLRAPSPDTGAYCRARAKITVGVIQRLALQVANAVEDEMPRAWRWHDRRVLLVDGTTIIMPDTPENQGAWPQPSSQKPGLGFPILRMVVLLSLATGMLCGMEEAPYKGKGTGEPALLREMLDSFREGDVLVADRYYCSYFMIALLLRRGVDVVMKLHQRRKFDFAKGRRLGKGEMSVTWKRPRRPDWMDEETYQSMPEELTLRLAQVNIHVRGFRVTQYALATTLMDREEYPLESLGELYFWRWHAELDIRQIKCTMHMERLTCKTPEMVRKELWMHCLAYNLVRRRMAQAALAGEAEGMAGLGGAWGAKVWRRLGPQGKNFAAAADQQRGPSPVRYLSFTSALQNTREIWLLGSVCSRARRRLLTRGILLMIASGRLPDRPFRVEPRAIKRRSKPHKLLRTPREQARAALCFGKAAAA